MDFSQEEVLRFVQRRKRQQRAAFYSRDETFEGHDIQFFNYFGSAGEVDFDCDIALECRGLCFVDGVRYLAQRKFFTLNQVSCTKESQLRGKAVEAVTDKLDGSLIRFIRLGGAIKAKSKMTVSAPVAQAADAVLAQDPVLRALVAESLDRRVALHFEYVGPDNWIVVEYREPRLILHSARDEVTGAMIPLADFARPGVTLCETILTDSGSVPLFEDLLSQCKTLEGREGFVVRFADGQTIKMKTEWYLFRHGCRHDQDMSDFDIVLCLANETADDVLQAAGEEVRTRVLSMQACWSRYFASCAQAMRDIVASFAGDRRAWYQLHGRHAMFRASTHWQKLGGDEQQLESVLLGELRQLAASAKHRSALLAAVRACSEPEASAAGQREGHLAAAGTGDARKKSSIVLPITDMKRLNEALSTTSYVEGGHQASAADFEQLEVISPAELAEHPHVERWAKHVRALSQAGRWIRRHIE